MYWWKSKRSARTLACRAGTFAGTQRDGKSSVEKSLDAARKGACATLVLLLLAAGCFAQTAADLESDSVKRVGSRIACKCGSCNGSISCDMPGGCGYCKRIKTQIAQKQAVGQSDKQIIDQLVAESGKDTYIGEPGIMGWLAPYLALGLGLAFLVWLVRRYVRTSSPATVPPVDPEVLNRYHDRIEKDLEKLE